MVTPVSKYFTEPENSTCVLLREPATEAWDWVKENCKGLYTTRMEIFGQGERVRFYFSDKNDAASFKMVWG